MQAIVALTANGTLPYFIDLLIHRSVFCQELTLSITLFQLTILLSHRGAPVLQQHVKNVAHWVKSCHCLCCSHVSQIHHNCQVTHHSDTQDVREACGRVSGYALLGYADVCIKLAGKRLLLLFALVRLLRWSVMLPEMSQHQWTLFKYSFFVRRDRHITFRMCELTWHKLIIASDVKREQASCCLSMSSFSAIWTSRELYIYIYVYIKLQIIMVLWYCIK